MADLPYPDSAEDRAERWAATMTGHGTDDVVVAHADSTATVGDAFVRTREAREDHEAATLATNATRALGAGRRAIEEAPDPFRTCFERDRDRILHDSAFRRLAGKTQVFVFPDDHQRTRMTHALEVAQVARSVAESLSLNVPLVEAMALGHDCGHGPGGHASEDALSPYLEGGFDHAPWGADVTLQPLNLCAETLDGIRNHSWSLPAPLTPEGEVVSWADRIAYVCHDFEDAAAAGIVTADMLPAIVAERCGRDRSRQLGTFVRAMVAATTATGRIGMTPDIAEALAEFRRFNYEYVYLRPASQQQAAAVVSLLRALVEHYADRPHAIPHQTIAAALGDRADYVDAGGAGALRAAVAYVAGMTDRFACQQGLAQLSWDPAKLPRGIGVSGVGA
ncbi:MAG TPA: HD domain-containing protein [Ilumatobacteraceae bacterium]|nr:HD domain-containing protein [Ilumatobacteraceae bacterium]